MASIGRILPLTTNIVSEEKHIQLEDEQALAKLLEAAYVLQEHNRKMQNSAPPHQPPAGSDGAPEPPARVAPAAPDVARAERPPNENFTFFLGQIVETQRQIQVRQLGLEDTMSLVVERLAAMTQAAGAAIGLVEGQHIRYRATAGRMALPVGTDVPIEQALSSACLRTGQLVRNADASSDSSASSSECRERGIHSMIAVPVYRDAGVSGSLELYYAGAHGFSEQEVHTCQLMSGLLTEALARDHELIWKKSLATERAAMMEALEKLKPNLAALVDTHAAKETVPPPAPAAAEPALCRKCGHQLVGDEHFCGKCGAPRSSDYEAPTMQSRVASLLTLREKAKKEATPSAGDSSISDAAHLAHQNDSSGQEDPSDDFSSEDFPSGAQPALFEMSEATHAPTKGKPRLDLEAPSEEDLEDEGTSSLPAIVATRLATARVETESPAALGPAADWSSAANAREFLEQQLASSKPPDALTRFWKARRGDVYLAVAVLLVAAAIRWGIWSDHPVGATGRPAPTTHHKLAPDADLSLFDRILINLGLAEAPEPVEYKGNPEAQVWVDLHTALYYCPGADLYGKTPTGKYTTQKDAQLDQFEPAYRKACQ